MAVTCKAVGLIVCTRRIDQTVRPMGRFEAVVLFGILSLVAQFVYWSRIVTGLNQGHA